MSDEFDVIDELGRPVHMPPRSSREVVIVTPEHIAALEAEIARLQGEQYLPGTPHSGPRACPMWYDRCLCTVGGLQFNIERAEKAEAEVARLREACKPFYLTDWPHRVHMHVDQQDQDLAERFATAMRGIHVALEPAP